MTVGRFTIRSRLGAGGMGEVYLAEDTKLRRPVALKRMAPTLRTDERYRHRFIKEAERASSLNDHRIASIYDVFEERDEMFVVMEYVEGMTLRQRLKEPFTWKEFLPVAADCAEAVVTAHEKGIVHRDIKPENIMLTRKGGVKILDFGVARRLPRPDQPTDSVPSGPGQMSGTLAYMAPEVLLGKESDDRADLFSIGVVFYEALAGRHPFLAPTLIATSDRILNAPATPLRQLKPELPEMLEQIVARLMAKDLSGRYARAAELAADLRSLERGEVRKLRSPTLWPRRFARPKVLIALLGTVLVALLLAALLPSLRQSLTRRQPSGLVPAKKYLAVLPFTPLAGDPETAAFSNGLAETVTARLGHVAEQHGLDVVPAAEVRAQHVRTLEEARREFAVNLVLQGSLQRSGGKVRVTYAIVDAQARRQLRAGTVTASAADVFVVEDRVVEGVLDNLEIALQPQERRALEARSTTQPAAYDYYLQGRGYLQGYQKAENIDRAIAAFNSALEIDPADSLARASLGEAYWRKYEVNKETGLVEKSRQACTEALNQNPSLAEPHLCMATLLNGTGEYERAASEFKLALAIEPNRDDTYRGLASAYARLGQAEKAEAAFQQAIAMRPDYWAGYHALGIFYLTHARYAKAATMFDRVVKLVPDSFAGYSNLCLAQLMRGLYAETVEACQRSIAIRPAAGNYSNLATAYYFKRQYAQAAETYEQALRMNDREYLAWGNLGDAYSWIPGGEARAQNAYHRAIALAREQLQVNPRDARTLGYLAWYQATTGERQTALATARRALRLAPNDSELLFNVALVYNQIGDPRQTLAYLEKARAAGFSQTVLRDTPNFDALRSNPRFQRLLEKK
jgi:tetratricopeptide (TPR) repeat protein/predicted Ser/Thr protein kinase